MTKFKGFLSRRGLVEGSDAPMQVIERPNESQEVLYAHCERESNGNRLSTPVTTVNGKSHKREPNREKAETAE